ncbi:MAG: phosphoenolpyruvate--protein phosphotransferase [Candidatus Latescibacterota bacterium]
MMAVTVLKGISASPGIAIGKAFLYHKEDFWIEERTIAAYETEAEEQRFLAAVDQVISELQKTKSQMEKELGKEQGQIFETHLSMLSDRIALNETATRIREELKNAEFAFFCTLRKVVKALRSTEDAYLKERIEDVLDIQRRVVMKLVGKEHASLIGLEADSIVVARNLAPSDTARIHREGLLGFITELGGQTSHTAIMARAMEIPAVVGTKRALEEIEPGAVLILDGTHGLVYVDPDEAILSEYGKRKVRWAEMAADLATLRDLPATTLDGTSVVVAANIEFPEEVESVSAHGAEGIGLYRTEFLYMMGSDLPTEQEQFEAYCAVVERIAPHPVVIRTMDLGGDKLADSLPIEPEVNPFLGWRAIRVCLDREDLFRVQLRAILRASARGNVRIMFPMISGIEEMRRAKELVESAKDSLRDEGIPFDAHCQVGAMIEIPSAVMIADQLAEVSDFFSIGTNDLVQYALAVDRGNERIAPLFDPFHPAVLRLIRETIDAGHRKGIPVAMCREMSGDPLATLLLLGLGLDEFSMSPIAIPEVKMIVRGIQISEAREIAERVMKMETKAEIRALLLEVVRRKFGDFLLE